MDWEDFTYRPGSVVRSQESLRQQIAYDMAPDHMLVSKASELGLHGASQDVVDAEMKASRQRRTQVAPLSPLLHILSGLSSEVQNAAILVGRLESGLTDPIDEITPQQIYSATFAILATLVDLGVVHLPHPVSGALS